MTSVPVTILLADGACRLGYVHEAQVGEAGQDGGVTVIDLRLAEQAALAGEVAVSASPVSSGDVATRAAQMAAAIGEALGQRDLRASAALLALPSTWCLGAAIAVDGLPRRGRHKAMVYRLEDKLPLSAEAFTADFLPSAPGHPPHYAYGIACDLRRLQVWTRAMEEAGIPVLAIAPRALLTAQHWMERQCIGDEVDGLLLACDDGLDLLHLQHTAPGACPQLLQWHHLAAMDHAAAWLEDLLRPLAHELGRPPRLRVGSPALPAPVHQTLTERAQLLAQQRTSEASSDRGDEETGHAAGHTAVHTVIHAAVRLGDHILRGRTAPWLNLRRGILGGDDPLHHLRRPLNAVLAAAAILLLTLTVGLSWRTWSYWRQAGAYEAAQQQVFLDLYPGRPTPLNIRPYLDSEQRRLAALAGGSDQMPKRRSALITLHEALRRLPTDLRYRLLELRATPEKFDLDGQARTHSDADSLAAALRAQQGFTVEPPRTERLREQGVAFTLHAQLIEPAPTPDTPQPDDAEALVQSPPQGGRP